MTDRSGYVGHQDSATTPVRDSRYHRPPPLPQEGTPLLALWKRPDTAGFELVERAMPAFDEHDKATLAKMANSSAYAKLAAARQLGLPVVMVRRPPPPAGPVVDSVEAALAWLERAA